MLVCCLLTNTVVAESQSKSMWGFIGGVLSNARDISSALVGGVWDDTTDWIVGAWDDTTDWLSQAWSDILEWLSGAWSDASEFVTQIWDDASSWTVSQWRTFTSWVITVFSENPYGWMEDSILENGVLAYDRYISIRSLLKNKPGIDDLKIIYYDRLIELSLLNEDIDLLWDLLEQWSAENKINVDDSAALALPFLEKLLVEGSGAIGDDIAFSGPVVAQYLITLLEMLKPDSPEKIKSIMDEMNKEFDEIVRPVFIGDADQNVYVTDDGHYIENFTYGNGNYQIILVASEPESGAEVSVDRVKSTTERYFTNVVLTEPDTVVIKDGSETQMYRFSSLLMETIVNGAVLDIIKENREYYFLFMTDGEFRKTDAAAWAGSISVDCDTASLSFEADFESDGAFYGINQTAQKYTINRIFEENRFHNPKTGHGWAAERGNNMVDNLKGVFRGYHSKIVGDNNVLNGADRMVTYSSGNKLFIQSKYYNDASKGIAACFENGYYKYVDASGAPMAVEVPSEQYENAILYMKNRIHNGQVRGVSTTDTDKAYEIVKQGNVTYKQAVHLAKSGTIESLTYDAVHACVSAGSAMGASALIEFGINRLNGQSFETAVKNSIYVGLKTGGTTFIISILSTQLAKSGLNTALIPASQVIVHAIGPHASAVIINAFRPAGSAIYGAAAMNSAAKLLRGNFITGTVTFVVLSAGDVLDIIRGRISWTQLAKNLSVTAAGVAGGGVGYIGGAALGTAILPGAGTVAGLIIGALAGWGASEGADAIADSIADDDAEKMLKIIEEQFCEIAQEYFLTEAEVNEAVTNLQDMLTAKVLKSMYQYGNYEKYARQLIEMSMDPVVAKREYVKLPDDETYSKYVIEVLEELYTEIEDSADEVAE